MKVAPPPGAIPVPGFEGIELEDRDLFAVLRRRAGLTQGEVATKIGVHQSNVSRWERGRANGLSGDDLSAAWSFVLSEGEAA